MVELTPERAIEVQNLLGSDIVMQLDECVRLPAERSEIARAMKLSLRWAERCKRAFAGAARRPRLVRHRAGRRRSWPAGGERARTRRYRLRRLRDRRPRRRRAAGGDVRRGGRDGSRAARRSAALPHGRRHAGGSSGRRRARRRHVRLRHADPQRPPRPRLHPVRPDQHQERPPRRRSAPARSRRAAAAPRAISRAPICIICSAPARRSAARSCRSSIYSITRT